MAHEKYSPFGGILNIEGPSSAGAPQEMIVMITCHLG